MKPAIDRAARSDWDRRQFVRGLGFGMLGIGLPELLRQQAQAAGQGGRARSCILIFLEGGPSQIDTFDMKPNAPAEYRGEFQPIATSVPDISMCEHLPRTARLAHHLAIVRSVTQKPFNPTNDHHAGYYYMLTGRRPDRTFATEGNNRRPYPDDWPCVGSAVAWRRGRDPQLPGYVCMPHRSGENVQVIRPGQFGALLGSRYDAVVVRGQLEKPLDLRVPQFTLPDNVPTDRLGDRRHLLANLDGWQRRMEGRNGPLGSYDDYQQQAFAMVSSARAKEAFDLDREPMRLRERYGANINAQSFLMARRLVEAGVPFVVVYWLGKLMGAAHTWDTHGDNFGILKNVLLPPFDVCFSALLEDLQERGLLERTVVTVMGEMGRTPKVGDRRSGGDGVPKPGRDHWTHLQTVLFAGGGIQGGQVYGVSDRIAAYPADRPVYPERIASTIYRAFGIGAAELILKDRLGRPLSLLEEAAPLPLFG